MSGIFEAFGLFIAVFIGISAIGCAFGFVTISVKMGEDDDLH